MNHNVKFTPTDEEQAIVLFDDSLASGQSIPTAMNTSVHQFPEQADFLADYVAMVKAQSIEQEDTDAYVLLDPIIEWTVNDARARMPVQLSKSLIERVKAGQISPTDICSKLAIGQSILSKLDRGLIEIVSIPERFLTRLAEESGVALGELKQIINVKPRLAMGSEFQSKRKPIVSKKESFERAIQTSVRAGEISETDANAWLERRDP